MILKPDGKAKAVSKGIKFQIILISCKVSIIVSDDLGEGGLNFSR